MAYKVLNNLIETGLNYSKEATYNHPIKLISITALLTSFCAHHFFHDLKSENRAPATMLTTSAVILTFTVLKNNPSTALITMFCMAYGLKKVASKALNLCFDKEKKPLNSQTLLEKSCSKKEFCLGNNSLETFVAKVTLLEKVKMLFYKFSFCFTAFKLINHFITFEQLIGKISTTMPAIAKVVSNRWFAIIVIGAALLKTTEVVLGYLIVYPITRSSLLSRFGLEDLTDITGSKTPLEAKRKLYDKITKNPKCIINNFTVEKNGISYPTVVISHEKNRENGKWILCNFGNGELGVHSILHHYVKAITEGYSLIFVDNSKIRPSLYRLENSQEAALQFLDNNNIPVEELKIFGRSLGGCTGTLPATANHKFTNINTKKIKVISSVTFDSLPNIAAEFLNEKLLGLLPQFIKRIIKVGAIIIFGSNNGIKASEKISKKNIPHDVIQCGTTSDDNDEDKIEVIIEREKKHRAKFDSDNTIPGASSLGNGLQSSNICMTDRKLRLIVSKGIEHGGGNLSNAVHIALYSKEETEVETFTKMLKYGFYQEVLEGLNSQVINPREIRTLLRQNDKFIKHIAEPTNLESTENSFSAKNALQTFLKHEIQDYGMSELVLLCLEKQPDLLQNQPTIIQAIIIYFYENRDEQNTGLLVSLFQNDYRKSWLETTTYNYYEEETVEIKDELLYQLISLIISDEQLYFILNKINKSENIISDEMLHGYFLRLGDNVDQNKFLHFYHKTFPSQFDNVFLKIVSTNLSLTNVILRFLGNDMKQKEFLLKLYLKNFDPRHIVENHLDLFTEENMEGHDVPNKKLIFFKSVINLVPNNTQVYLPMIRELQNNEKLILNNLYQVIPEAQHFEFLDAMCKVLFSKTALDFAKTNLSLPENMFFALLYENQSTPSIIIYIMQNILQKNVQKFLEGIHWLQGNDNKRKKQRDILGFLKMGCNKFNKESWEILLNQLTSTCDGNLRQNYFDLPLKDINEESANAFYNAINPNQHQPIKAAFEAFMQGNDHLKEKPSPWHK